MNNLFTEVERGRAAKIVLVLGVLGAIFLAGLAWNEFRVAGFVGRDGMVQSTITVDGKGEVVTKPDIATFSFSVTEDAATVAAAQKKSSERMNRALALLKDAGVKDEDIKTVGYNINPKYEYQNCGPFTACPTRDPKVVGYQVSQSIEVKVRNIEKAGDLLSGVGSVGVQNISGLTFSVDDDEKFKAEAREKAITQARDKAETLASSLNVRLVRVISFYETGNAGPIYGLGGGVAYDKVATPMAPNVSVPAGENKIVSQVSVTYEIR